MSQISSETQSKLFAMSPCNNQKQITYFQYTVVQIKDSHSKWEEWGIERKDGPKQDLSTARQTICATPPTASRKLDLRYYFQRTWETLPFGLC